jgi:hypothetical protein
VIGGTTPSTGKFTSLTNTGLTSGRVVYTTTGGLETTSGNLTFDGSTVTALNTAYTGTLTGGTGVVNLGSGQFYKDASGKVLIGASSSDLTATTRAMVIGSEGFAVQYAGTTGTYFKVTPGAANDVVALTVDARTGAYPSMTFGTSATERMRIDSSGNLLVGTTNNSLGSTNNFYCSGVIASGAPTSTGYSNVSAAQLEGPSGRIFCNHINGTDSGAFYLGFGYNGGGIGSITQSGNTAVLYNSTSDARLKENIVDAPLGNIDDVKVRSFDWKSDGSHVEYGFIAQELVEVAPYAVHQPQDPKEMMAVDYSKLVPMMIKEIQDLKQRIKTLENK